MLIKRLLPLLCGAVFVMAIANGCDELTGIDEDDLDHALAELWMPLIEGATWQYQFTESESNGESWEEIFYDTYTVSGTTVRNGKTYVQVFPDYDADRADLYRIEDGVIYEWARDGPEEIPILDLSLGVGESLPIEQFWTSEGDTIIASGALTYTGTENVTTPAGTFTCRVYELQADVYMSFMGTFAFTGTNWFAQGVGRVKDIHLMSADSYEYLAIGVLQYFNIPGGLSGGTYVDDTGNN